MEAGGGPSVNGEAGRPRMVVAGAGSVGLHCLRIVESRLPAISPMTAQHAQRQGHGPGSTSARRWDTGSHAATGTWTWGFVVDLGGSRAVADPLHIPLTGPLAEIIIGDHQLLARPACRPRVALDWLAGAVAGPRIVQFGLVSETAVRPADADRIA